MKLIPLEPGLALAVALVASPHAAAAAALLSGDLPAAVRVERLAKYFTPPPGASLSLGSGELRDHRRRAAADQLRGSIRVRPPQGHCLTIQRAIDQSDEVICREQTLSFLLTDLDRAGRMQWRVSTGAGDFGTDLQWSSPYRLGSVIPFGSDVKKDPPVYKFIVGCHAQRAASGRRLVIEMASGETWLVHFPDRDQLAPQPEDTTNLDVDYMTGKRGVKEASEVKEAAESEGKAAAAAKDAAKGSEGEGKGKASAEGEGKAKEGEGKAKEGEGEKPKDPAQDQHDDRLKWAIPARHAYMMSSDHFQPQGSVPRGIQGGECRYIYQGPAEDPGTGRLECHEVDGYQQVFLPLTCLRHLQ